MKIYITRTSDCFMYSVVTKRDLRYLAGIIPAAEGKTTESKITLILSLQERSCLKHNLELKIERLNEARIKAETLKMPATKERIEKERKTLTDILAKL